MQLLNLFVHRKLDRKCFHDSESASSLLTAFIKRTFSEHVTARKYPHMVKKILLKATLYNMFNRMI